MPTRTKFVILMHPYEFKRIKANTGRLTHICLPDSELFVGESFDTHEEVQALIRDPKNYPVLLYPGKDAIDLSKAGSEELSAKSSEAASDASGLPAPGSSLQALRSQLESRRLVVFLLDATWRLARPMLRKSLTLQALPQIMFSNAAPSRYRIKLQPEPGCLSTLEAVHEMLLALDRTGLDTYTLPKQLLDLFERMQDFQIARTAETRALGIRRHALKPRREAPSVMPPRSKRRKKIFPVAPPS
jgi:DTW domain-containing protein YfiP